MPKLLVVDSLYSAPASRIVRLTEGCFLVRSHGNFDSFLHVGCCARGERSLAGDR